MQSNSVKFGNNGNVLWKEDGFGDKFRIIPNFSGSGTNNKLIIQSTTGEAGTDPQNWKDLVTIHADPANLFGGKWEQIKDRFLLSAGNSYANGSTGGNATHKHLSPMTWYENGGSNIGTTNLYGFDKVYNRDFYGIANQKIEYNKTVEKLAYRTSTESNMPPYLVVFVWKRTA